jgi:LEA14-like dessication related protein
VNNRNLKKAGLFILSIFLLAGGLVLWLYHNRLRYVPKVKQVTYMHVESTKGKAVVHAGIRVQNRIPFSLQIDSVSYQIRNKGVLLAWGKKAVKQILPATADKVLDLRLFLDTNRYRKQLAKQHGRKKLDLDVQLKVYLNPPLLDQHTITVNRSLSTAIPKGPAIRIDTFFVKSFSPEAGYTFQLTLNTGNANLPNLEIADLNYSIRLSDSLVISNKIDSTFRIKKGEKSVPILIHLETAELIELLRKKQEKQTIWPYEVKASAILKTGHHLFENTAVTVTRSGLLDTRKAGSGTNSMPSVKQIKRLVLIPKAKNTILQADLLVYNPTKLPLYIDSATYYVRYKGKVLARGAKDFEKVLPAKANKRLQLELTVNNNQYRQLMAQPKNKNEIPLEVELRLHYNLKNSKPQLIAIKEKITIPVTKGPTFEFVDVRVKQLDQEQGAQLFVKLKVKNQGDTRLQIDDLKYRLLLKKDIAISGQMQQPIALAAGTSEIEIPVNLSGNDLNQVAKGLIQGIETWDYTLSGTATVSTPNSLLHQTEVALQTSGVYNINSKGTPDYMPEISKIDTLYLTMHRDTAWVRMYAAIYNTLPATVHLSQLQVTVIHENDTIAKTRETLDTYLVPDANTFAWHTLGIKYGLWQKHVERNQDQDSIQLTLPVFLTFNLGNLNKQQVLLDLSTSIPTPGSPTTLLRRLQLRSFRFRDGLKFDALVTVQNANSEGLTIKNIDYRVTLENGVKICGKINRTYKIPVGKSEVQVPVTLTLRDAVKLVTRQWFGPHLIGFKLNATAQVHTDNPKLSDVYVIYENHDQSDLRREKK